MQKSGGMFFFLGGSTILMGIITAEIYFPGTYSISHNMISNLGSTPPPTSIIHQPAADIFDYSLLAAGTLILLGTFFLRTVLRNNILLITSALMGLGTLGVGVFPAFHLYAHPLSAFLAFSAGGVSAVVSSRVTKNPFASLSVILGLISLIFLFLGIVLPQTIVPILGTGGTERWVAYPMVLWLVGFGGYLMGEPSLLKSQKRT